MFRKIPYWGWLSMAILLWCLAAGSRWKQHQGAQPAAMARALERDLQLRDARLQQFLQQPALRRHLLQRTAYRFFQDSTGRVPFALNVYQGDSLISWTDDDLLAPYSAAVDTTGHLALVNDQYCIRKTYLLEGKLKLIALLPVKWAYPFENRYLKISFPGQPQIPAATAFAEGPQPGTYALKSASGATWCYLRFPEGGVTALPPDISTVVLALLAILATVLWLQLLLVKLARLKSWRWASLLTVLLVAVLWLAAHFGPLPFAMRELELFSPTVYAYSALLPSLGDLLFNELAMLWILVFVITETPYQSYWTKVTQPMRLAMAVPVLAAVPAILLQLWLILRSLVIDSQLSLDLSHFHNINAHTILGLLGIVLALVILELCMRFLRAQLVQLIGNRWLRLFLVCGISLWAAMVLFAAPPLMYLLVGWLCLYFLLFELRIIANAGLVSLQALFVSLFTCCCIGFILHDLERVRDLEKDRIAFAQHLLARQDPLLEYNFKSIVPHLQHDAQIKRFLRQPSADAATSLVRRLNTLYFNVLANRYEPEFYLFGPTGNARYNKDTTSARRLQALFEEGTPTEDGTLVFHEESEAGNYLARIPITTDTPAAGVLYVRLALKKNIHETVYPQLLQPATVNRIEQEGRYSYALYYGGRRVTQTSNYNFPAFIDTAGRQPVIQVRQTGNGFYELRYQEVAGNAVIVAGSTGSWMSAAILLSYLFGLHLACLLMALVYRLLLRFSLRDALWSYHLTLQQRIHLGIQIMLLLSLLVVGVVTVAFFRERYRKASRARMHLVTQTVERTVRQFLAAQGGLGSPAQLDSVAQTPEFRYMLNNMAAAQQVDANLFARSGRLLNASREDLYEQGLLARIIGHEAFRQLQLGRSMAEEAERVGTFRYLTCNTAIRSDEGAVLGYISVPFFSYRQELNDQVSNIVIALISFYAILFFLSSFLAWFISTRLTRAFHVLINQFGRLNLQKNELLEWPYQDEIGLLVNEYNKMAQKVEEQAALLAQDERESAWREMARQVAHEIKNPLTPMKLNIQYLQQALQSKRPDVETLAARVSASIIEQIDNLTYIASEFSNFAKMPEARPELLNLNELVQKALPLYQGKPNIRVTAALDDGPAMVLADYSQLLRVFTNLMQNAVQAIPQTSKNGHIRVLLQRDASSILLTVADNGAGIEEATKARIFKPYFTTKSSGTGLGLAMSRKIIELWKGTIWFESNLGEGTAFFVRLPLHTAAPADAQH